MPCDESDARKTLLTLAMLGSSAVNSSSDEKARILSGLSEHQEEEK